MSSLPRDQQTPRDIDPQETLEWLESLDSVVEGEGHDRARFLMDLLLEHARSHHVAPTLPLTTDFVNTIAPEDEPAFPGDEWMEKRIRRIIRWNAMAMVTRANQRFEGIGGHISTYASAATLYEVGFNHFFRGREDEGGGDHVYFQGHASPGIYARAFLEGRLSEDQLNRFRREVERGQGLPSYPHPRLMPDFWEFPTVSMGLGPLNAIYQARFLRYLKARGIADTSRQRVWAFCGDGEMDEPESLAGLSIAGRERLDNLTFVINCNLQRLDGPVRGNAKIVQELEALFRGAGWNVIKVIWGRGWDPLFEADDEGLLRHRCNEVVDGQFQKYTVSSGDFVRKDFFGAHPKLLEMVSHLTDEQITQLRRGGHDYRKVHAAYRQATRDEGRPTCILAHTVKGWTLGEGFEARNTTHQMKKLKEKELFAFRDVLQLPIPDEKLSEAPFFHPGPDSEEVQYLVERRRALGGFVPKRRMKSLVQVPAPPASTYDEFLEGTKSREGVSTTMAFARMLAKLLRDEHVGDRIVPIIPDEARTFGMDPLFRQVGIYASLGQLYEPVDKNMLLYYRETKDGQVLEEGINEAGSMASFTAAGTSYSTQGQPMVPFYIFYSMFGFQRVGDLIWAFGDSRGRGFLLGATAGRTTLNGEGLQHEDGHSHLIAATVPHCRAYDPAFAYEIAVIIEDGLKQMLDEEQDLLYYITLQNENYPMPAMPEGAREGILAGLYPFQRAARKPKKGGLHVNLLGSGSIMGCVLAARDLLAERFSVTADVWAAPSYTQLRADCLATERWNRLHPTEKPRTSHLERTLKGATGPFVAASDWMTALPELVARWMPRPFVTLGTDGYGMSDTRPALRRHFEVDAESIVIGVFDALRQAGQVDGQRVAEVIAALDYDADKLFAPDV